MMHDSDAALAFPVIGLAIGSTLGTLSNLIPFGFSVASWLAVFFLFFKGMHPLAFMILGLAWGSVIGAMANVISFDIVEMTWLAFFFVELNSNSGIQQQYMSSAKYVIMPLVLMTVGGIIYYAYPDFQNGTGNGFGSNWQGCQTSCVLFAINILPTTIFQSLATGNLVGFITGLFSNIQGLLSILSLAAGAVLLMIGLGIGGALNFLTFGVSVTISDSGSRLCMSLGLAMTLYAITIAIFGGWFSILSPQVGFNVLIPGLFLMVCFYGAYIQAKTVGNA